MKKILCITVSIFIILTASIGFSDFFITYTSGTCKVDKEGNGKFRDAAIDTELSASSVIRTGPDGTVELSVDEETISIGGNSTVKMSDLLVKMNEKRKNGWMSNVSKYTKAIARGGGAQTSTALAGVRGKKSVSDDIEWFEEGTETSGIDAGLQKAKDLFNEGRYVQAIPVFKELIGKGSSGSVQNEASFYLGVSLFNVLRYNEALAYLKESLGDKATDYHEAALFHYAFTNYMLERYEQAASGFEAYRREFPEGDLEPYTLLMLGKINKKMGNRSDAKRFFTDIKREYSETDVARYADEELEAL